MTSRQALFDKRRQLAGWKEITLWLCPEDAALLDHMANHVSKQAVLRAALRLASKEGGMTDDELPKSIAQSSLMIGDIELRCHVLDDGRRIFEQDGVEQFFARMAEWGPADVAMVAVFIQTPTHPSPNKKP